MSTLRHGKIEKAIAAEIANVDRFGERHTVLIRSGELADDVFRPEGSYNWKDRWEPSLV